MAYAGADLQSFAQGSGVRRLWHYVTADSEATVLTAAYFNSAADRLAVGDLIFVYFGLGGTAGCRLVAVTANTGSAVTILKDSIA